MSKQIVIVDYGMGNLKSVQNAIRLLGYKVVISDDLKKVSRADKIIFPGVGHFKRAIIELKKRKLFKTLKGTIADGTPFFGICLGMQVLFDKSQEAPGVKGLGLIPGEVRRFLNRDYIVPHMGWNSLSYARGRLELKKAKIFNGIKEGSFFYFVHSYYCIPKNPNRILTLSNYGIDFASSINYKNIWAVQFHAEKSQALGLRLLNNFLKLC